MTPNEHAAAAPVPSDAAATPRARRGQPRRQVVDSAVSRRKFDREVDGARRHEAEYRQQGWLILSAEFPEVFLVLTVPQLRPAPVLFGVLVDFSNYDVDPPSVRLVSPWTREPLQAKELLSPLPRLAPVRIEAPAPEYDADATPPSPGEASLPVEEAAPMPVQVEFGHLMQWWTPESIPFLCMRGVREYHRHPAHTGDAWLLHRRRGEGTLSALLAAIHAHASAPIRDYTYSFSLQNRSAQHNAFVQHVAANVRGFLNVLPDGQVYPWPA